MSADNGGGGDDDDERKAWFERMLMGSFARNGLNTLMLDIRDAVTELKTDMRHVIRRQEAADESRSDLHKKMNAVQAECSAVREQNAAQSATLARIEPLVDAAEQRHQRELGHDAFWAGVKDRIVSWWTALIGGAGGTGILAYFNWDKIAATVKGWFS